MTPRSQAPPAPLCDDHANGWTVRYSGRNLPRFGCPECLEIYRGQSSTTVSPALELTRFSKLDIEGKQRILLGKERFTIVGFDLECTSLKPNVGRILCCSFKPLGGDPYTFSALDARFKQRDVYDDGKLAAAIRDELERYDIIVGWNSKMFDAKFLNSRCIRVGQRTKVAQYHVDGMWSWRSKFSAWSGLNAVQQFSLPQAETTKTSVEWEEWMRALGWDKKLREAAMAEITDHCERDVVVLEDVYRLLVGANVIRSIRRDGGVL
jgi:uncharacterized protein YprB with RNaseH-like and TPR domain